MGERTELRRRLAASLRAGEHLLLYGPPGCGKRFLARAVAGELGRDFMAVSLADLPDLHAVFALAHGHVLYLAQLDAVGRRRAQLVAELDNVGPGVLVLAATNAPWAVDPALRGPGRLPHAVLVPPPDADARTAILRHRLADRSLAEIDLNRLAARAEGMTGADLVNVCETAAERAAASGTARMIDMRDLNAALAEVRPSARAWFDAARLRAHGWDELARYFR